MDLVRRWGPAIVWAAVIFVLSAQPGLRVSSDADVERPIRQLAHLLVYGTLAVLLCYAIAGAFRVDRRTALIAVVLAVAYGVTDEIHQSFVPERSGQVGDLVWDAIGAVAGCLAVAAWWRIAEQRGGTRSR
jgi:VanZ family protein